MPSSSRPSLLQRTPATAPLSTARSRTRTRSSTVTRVWPELRGSGRPGQPGPCRPRARERCAGANERPPAQGPASHSASRSNGTPFRSSHSIQPGAASATRRATAGSLRPAPASHVSRAWTQARRPSPAPLRCRPAPKASKPPSRGEPPRGARPASARGEARSPDRRCRRPRPAHDLRPSRVARHRRALSGLASMRSTARRARSGQGRVDRDLVLQPSPGRAGCWQG